MAQLAIRGHETRGKEVIEILKMLGAKEKHFFDGEGPGYYYIDEDNNISYKLECEFHPSIKPYSLADFFEKFPYKVGDKVQHKGATSCGCIFVIEKMQWVDSDIEYTIRNLWNINYRTTVKAEELQPYKEENFAECIENTVQECLFGKEKTMEEKGDKAKAPNLIGEDYSGKRFGYKIPKGYEFDCIKNNEIILKIKQPEYPKNYKECCDVLGINTMDNDAQGYKGDLIISFQELIIARDAYYKIAGEQMGLGKPWKPNFDDIYTNLEYIKINKGYYIYSSRAFAFPNKEIRDIFYENFKETIKQCKELL